ncbi:MAG: phosphoenolpyruvate synthase [Zoogloeaceae bacterium]|nr:phosphoenolpyruvate synthase [Zoogloeaceae bacterium]
MSAPAFLPWPESFASGPAAVGGKGWNLARLARYGFRVPAGGVLPVSAWTAFAAQPAVASPLAAVLAETDGATLALETAILTEPMPPAVLTALDAALAQSGLTDQPLAVRSSAVGEDSDRASFAGILASRLHVCGREEVLAAVRQAWASAWSPRALAYRRRLGLPAESGAPAVVLMAMAPAASAGVAFSCDPRSGREDRVFVAANFGLGETVVAGTADPDEWAVHVGFHGPECQVIEYRPGAKALRCEPQAQGGTVTRSAPTEVPALPEDALLDLARAVVRIRDALGHGEIHQDVEWTWDGQRLWFVQARPVTARPAYTYPALTGLPTIWSNGNIRDSLPMVAKPLTWSLAPHTMDDILLSGHRAAHTPILPGITRSRLYQGRGYFNVSAVQWEYWEGFGFPPAITNRLMGGHQPDLAVPPPRGWRVRLRQIGANLRLTRALAKARKAAPAQIAEMREAALGVRRQDWNDLSDAALARRFHEGMTRYDRLHALHLVHSASAGGYLLLTALLGLWLPERERETLARGLLTQTGAITSAEHGEKLAALAQFAEAEPAARACLTAQPLDPWAWQRLPASSRFRQALTAFLDEYGHRAVYELDVANARWREDPRWLLETLRDQLDRRTLAEAAARRAAATAQAWDRLKARTPVWLRPAVLAIVRRLVRQAGLEAAQREAAKSAVVHGVEIARLHSREAGRRLVSRGVIAASEDVDFLTLEDLVALLTGVWRGEGARALVADRRQRHLRLTADPEPPDLLEDDTPRRAPVSLAGREAPPGTLAGLGVAAGGARGIARIVMRPEDGARLAPGEILVAPSTDPAWTPLFLRAAALVTESGGFISHGAIVAREYGLPAVVNVAGALERIQDGQQVEVDGDRGWVRPL